MSAQAIAIQLNEQTDCMECVLNMLSKPLTDSQRVQALNELRERARRVVALEKARRIHRNSA
jgi:hypothetical protein